jgi:hypothetical protein
MRTFTYDANLLLKDSVAVTATGAAQVAAANKVFDTGYNQTLQGLFKGVAVIDVTNIKTSTGDETYSLFIQGSNSPTFASGVENLAEIDLGAVAVRKGAASVLSVAGRYEVLFQNEQADVMYQYIRLYFVIAGTTPTITNTCFIGRDFLAT